MESEWNGNLVVHSGRNLLFIFQISKTAGKLEPEIAIPGQGIKGIKLTLTTFEDSTLLIYASNAGFKYTGKWNASTGIIEGTFQEGVNKVPLALTKGNIEEVKLNKPQVSIKLYPY